jgi:hypothetical protein
VTRSPLNTVVYVGSSSGLEANARLVLSNYPRRDGGLSRMLEKFSTVEEPLKNEFHNSSRTTDERRMAPFNFKSAVV